MIGNTADTDQRSDNMPEFILDHGSPEGSATFAKLDYFTQGYIEAMFFTSTGTGDDAENDLEHATVGELAPETLARIVRDCERFQAANTALLYQAMRSPSYDETDEGYGLKQAGRDFWYTRNGHGTGFWDRGLGDVGDKLSEAAGRHEVSLYRGDDGLLYL